MGYNRIRKQKSSARHQPENKQEGHSMKQEHTRRRGLWALLKRFVMGLFGPIERGKYQQMQQ